ncbi:hypothetical protein ADK67_48195 [Saccharothrix sp. NRRL B-16348]|uniref:DUF4158 domain-containing protein n=1 Tax=Saccharothrix sp. NRRL B-16348 TaxID=1415542 RepID=UPI0006AEECCA|nr:DUF4158 domain-containing protein [Saccharothrix sp. NRRL B-16348]KOX11916.1 hypothetical protein ADK67_48195 [Saccharothrix sp. NRRL B-16348]
MVDTGHRNAEVDRVPGRADRPRLQGLWRAAKAAEWKDLEEFLLARALEHDAPSVLVRLACEYLHSVRIVRPCVVPLLRAVATARERAAAETYSRLSPLLGASRQAELDGLLIVRPELAVSRWAWLHRGTTTASPMAIRAELDKLRFLRELDAHALDLSVLPDARRWLLAGIGRRSTNQALQRREVDRRYPILVATLAECAVEVLDEVVQMFDQALSGTENRARRRLDELLAARAVLGAEAGPAGGDAGGGHRPWCRTGRGGLRLREGIGMDRMLAARRDPKDRLPRDHGHLAQIDASFTYLRAFAPHVVGALEFESSEHARPLVEAVGVLRELYGKGRARSPAGRSRPLRPRGPRFLPDLSEIIRSQWVPSCFDERGGTL